MFYKIFLGLFLIIGNAAAQDSAIYTHSRIHTRVYGKKNKKIKKEESIEAAGAAQVIYSPTYLLVKTAKGADTVFLASINTATSATFERTIYIAYNSSEVMELFFYDKRDAAKCKKFMRENGYKRETVMKIVAVISGVAVYVALSWVFL